MITLNDIEDLSSAIKNNIDGINFKEMVATIPDIVTHLAQRSKHDNHLLFATTPKYGNTKNNIDNPGKISYCEFLLVDKINYTSTPSKELLQKSQIILDKVVEIEEYLKNFKHDYDTDIACKFRNINIASINIEPVWYLAECNGWSINFFVDS